MATTPPAAIDPAQMAAGKAMVEAEQIFTTRCAVCHGTGGKGDGSAAKGLQPPPRDYTDKAWQSQVTDEQIAKAIVEGGPAIGKSPIMAANVDLKDKPQVVAELVKLIRGFAK